MVAAYVEAGFPKIHLDTSMGCAGEPAALADATTADARRATSPRRPRRPPTRRPRRRSTSSAPRCRCRAARSRRSTICSHRARGRARDRRRPPRAPSPRRGLEAAFDRAIGVVVQPGVEFGNDNVVVYDRRRRAALGAALDRHAAVRLRGAFDRLPAARGARAPWSRTASPSSRSAPGSPSRCARRSTALDHIAADARRPTRRASLQAAMERLMLASPAHWQKYYHGDARRAAPAAALQLLATASATTGPRPRPAPPSTACSPASTAAASRKPWSASTSPPSTPRSPPAGSARSPVPADRRGPAGPQTLPRRHHAGLTHAGAPMDRP